MTQYFYIRQPPSVTLFWRACGTKILFITQLRMTSVNRILRTGAIPSIPESTSTVLHNSTKTETGLQEGKPPN